MARLFLRPTQLIAAAVIGGGATLGLALLPALDPRTPDLASHENRDVNLDIGEHVHVDAWAGDRTARVQHRGSSWGAKLAPGAAPRAGEHVVSAVEGNWLVLSPSLPH